MTNNDFNKVVSMLKGNFPRLTLFDSAESSNVAFNALNRFDSRDILAGVRAVVEELQYPPSLKEIIDAVERAERNRHADERENARKTWSESVHCTKCNDSGTLYMTFRKPTSDPEHCWPDDDPKYPGPYDYTEVTMPCDCAVAKEKFPWAFMDELEWAKWVDDERRKGRNPPRKKPGLSREEIEKEAGELYSIRPGRRPQVFTRGKE